jgi:hypothetical protein
VAALLVINHVERMNFGARVPNEALIPATSRFQKTLPLTALID